MKEGWEYKTLGEVGSFKRGGNFSKKDFVKDGFPCIHYGQIHTKFGIFTEKHLSCVPANIVKKERCAKKGDLVIAITSEDEEGSCKCTAWMADYEAYVGGHTAIYSHTLNPLFMSYYFKSPIFQIEKLNYTHGFKVVEISPKDIAKIKIPIPSLEEQRRIVSYLDSSFKLIDEIKNKALKSLTEAKALFQSALAEAMEPKEGWEEKTLGEIAKDSADGPFGSNLKKEHYTSKREVRIIQLSNIGENGWREENTKYTTYKHLNTISRSEVHPGDIVIAKMMPAGRAILCPEKEKKYVLSSDAVKIVLKKGYYNRYFFYSINSDYFRIQVYENVSGSGRVRTSLTKLRNCIVRIPPLPTQKQIVSHLDKLSSKVRAMEDKYQKMVEECDALKQAMLRDVFE